MTIPVFNLDASELLRDFKDLADLLQDLEGYSKYLDGSDNSPWVYESHGKILSGINKLAREHGEYEPIPGINHPPSYDNKIVQWLLYLNKGILRESELNDYFLSGEQSESQTHRLNAVAKDRKHIQILQDEFGDKSLLVDPGNQYPAGHQSRQRCWY